MHVRPEPDHMFVDIPAKERVHAELVGGADPDVLRQELEACIC